MTSNKPQSPWEDKVDIAMDTAVQYQANEETPPQASIEQAGSPTQVVSRIMPFIPRFTQGEQADPHSDEAQTVPPTDTEQQAQTAPPALEVVDNTPTPVLHQYTHSSSQAAQPNASVQRNTIESLLDSRLYESSQHLMHHSAQNQNSLIVTAHEFIDLQKNLKQTQHELKHCIQKQNTLKAELKTHIHKQSLQLGYNITSHEPSADEDIDPESLKSSLYEEQVNFQQQSCTTMVEKINLIGREAFNRPSSISNLMNSIEQEVDLMRLRTQYIVLLEGLNKNIQAYRQLQQHRREAKDQVAHLVHQLQENLA